MSVRAIINKVKAGELKAYDVVEEYLNNIALKDEQYNCFINIDREGALRRAAIIDEKIRKGEDAGALAGLVVAVKDNICVKDMNTTCGSNILRDFRAPYYATVISKLLDEGAIIIGKTNMDEFAMGSTTETSAWGVTKNPCDINRVAGGSSGGSCAAVALDEAMVALGSDTGGSIRQPASFCGVVGLKPTYGTVSRYGLVAYCSSFDQIGPVTKNVSEAALLLEAISGYDEKDSTSVKRDNKYVDSLKCDVSGMRIGLPREYLACDMEEAVRERVLAAAEALKAAGAVVTYVDMPYLKYELASYYTIACAQASSNLERFDGVKYGYRASSYKDLDEMYKVTRSEGFGTETKRRIMLGTYVLSAGYYDRYYMKALKIRRIIMEEYDRLFKDCDVILGPVAPTTAPLIGSYTDNPLKMYEGDIFTIGANLVGLPAISVPYGEDERGLKIGISLMSNCFEENKILRAAYTLECLRDGGKCE